NANTNGPPRRACRLTRRLPVTARASSLAARHCERAIAGSSCGTVSTRVSASTTVSGRSPGTVESPRSRSQALTPKASAARAVRIIRRMSASERALHNFDVEALDDIALLDVLELAEAHAAFLTHLHRSEEHTSELQSRENLVCR